jgi:hypothetical protein
MLKKIFLGFSVVLVISGVFTLFRTNEVNAADIEVVTSGHKCATSFLGFRSWYQGLSVDTRTDTLTGKPRCAIVPPCARTFERDSNGQYVLDADGYKKPVFSPECPRGATDITAFVWIIVMNILFDLFLAVGYLSVGFLMLGGYWYILAQGNPSKIERGKKTIMSAMIGTVIAVFATIISNTIMEIVSKGERNTQWGLGDDGTDLLSSILSWAYIALGALGVIMMIYAGFQWITSAGDAGKAKTARMTMIYAAVGIVIVIAASAITGLIAGAAG